MRCVNCSKIFTITTHRGKVDKALCPYCLTVNSFIKNEIEKTCKEIGYRLTSIKFLKNDKK